MSEALRLDPHTIDEIVAICDTMLATLSDAIDNSEDLAKVGSFGGFESAEQLRQGFLTKARGTPESAYERLTQFHEVLSRMRDTFAAGGQGFLDADYDWARQLGTTDSA
ncbi:MULTISPECIES: hypothetical protein [Rhodococcus]|uniref:hypothetical protein n=1 Tax=Rhodococcus TaxID=1827 RepID=UPI000C9A8549|nr:MULTISPECIES: hypothetical protein [Rhodococcus]NCL75764.1 hypothetical protein [Rhodococcus sp. YH1]MDV6295838.1 hypothetical protein [Rhodococcus aetherivorans]PND50467.1 hypothetical protein CQZ88_19190 [Rhodococcus sp. ENV425]UGQ41849.1 hypothetical protein LRQ66_00465 [Rhodococcus aetherivorans]WFS11336.1 hypothetical protein P9K37_16115 [Rhodococcus aetherivorans]